MGREWLNGLKGFVGIVVDIGDLHLKGGGGGGGGSRNWSQFSDADNRGIDDEHTDFTDSADFRGFISDGI